ncbi:MAG: S1C family serine protease [Alphaproteobacteria bacterium]|nr:S1C family serine protease [Alphaproteobacteria bacterium]MCZ6844683.1 S1C family serine protease [Alphaproteobacteria bacterium]
MTDPSNPQFWSTRLGSHPEHDDVSFDLDTVLSSVVSLRATVPEDAFTAPILGTEREGQGVVIDDSGRVLTIGYLVTEAEEVWLIGNNNMALPAHVVAYDQESGLGLVQALGDLGLPAADIGESLSASVGDPVIVAGQGGAEEAVNAQVVSVREFAGSWEYLLDDAIFTIPAHAKWSGAGVFNRQGQLIGIGSLYIQQAIPGDEQIDGNMIVPIDILKPIYDDLLTLGRPSKPPRPWLGMTTAEADDRLVVAGLAKRGPAMRSGIDLGDLVVGVAGEPVTGLSTMFRKIWALGSAGVPVPLTLERDGRTLSITVDSGARSDYLKKPSVN